MDAQLERAAVIRVKTPHATLHPSLLPSLPPSLQSSDGVSVLPNFTIYRLKKKKRKSPATMQWCVCLHNYANNTSMRARMRFLQQDISRHKTLVNAFHTFFADARL